MSGEVLHFLSPSLGSTLELVFCSVILGGMLVSLATAEYFGRPHAWERNWQGGTHEGALDIDHGSIGELNQAVATLPERIVGNMPGLLLIVGLLGTFLGLGMALDKASAILQTDSLNAMTDSLSQLTGMMKDLGTKFKTSTWGIIAFIVLKLWDSARWSAESRRTGWCVDRMKREIDQAREAQKALDDNRERLGREALQAVGERLVQAIGEQSQLLATELKHLRVMETQRGRKQDEQFGQLDSYLSQHLAQLQQLNAADGSLASLAGYSAHLPRLELLQRQDESLVSLDASVGRLQAQLERTSQQLADLGQASGESNQRIADLQQTATAQLEHARLGAEQIERQASELTTALDQQHREQLKAQRKQTDELLGRANDLNQLATHTNQLLESVDQHTLASQRSLAQFVDSSADNLKALEHAGTTMGQAAEQLAGSAGALESSVEVMEKNVSGVIDKLNADFQKHLQHMQQSLDGNIARLSDVMNDLQSGLMDNVNQMSQDFTRNTAAMSENLKGATDNISSAVDGLTGEVKDVMAKVSDNIEAANVSQRKVGSMVISTNDGLNGAIENMKTQMEMIAGHVTQGLGDVSENSKRMASVGKHLVKFPELAQSFDKLHERFDALLAQGAHTTQVLDRLPELIHADLTQNGKQLAEAVGKLNSSTQQNGRQVAELPQALAEKFGEQFSNHLHPLQEAAGSTVALLRQMADHGRQPQARQPADQPLTA